MEDFYQLKNPAGPPTLPGHWSWSGLESWRRCPRQWWLQHARYSNVAGSYPARVYPATIEGNLVHFALNAYAAHAARVAASGVTDPQAIRSSFPVREVIRSRLKTELRGNDNPRLDRSSLLAKVSIDDSVNAFRVAMQTLPGPLRDSSHSRVVGASSQDNWLFGDEVWLQADDPRICGRLDKVRTDGITDYKTGDPSDTHASQLRFYALLFWLVSGRLPLKLTLAYPKLKRVVSVPTPTSHELDEEAVAYRKEIERIESECGESDPQANPSEANCMFCSVRQLCSVYWASPATNLLRLSSESVPSRAGHGGAWLDVELSATHEAGTATRGSGGWEVRGVGAVDATIPASNGTTESSDARSVRLLGARVCRQESVRVTVGSSTEVFWVA